MSDDIAFFSDLPIKAIPAVQRLYDATQMTGYSLPKVYSDLVSSLNKADVTPPARKLVIQWLAAVKCGMAGRPEFPASIETPVSPLAPTPGYFESLPDAAMPALTEAWDAIQGTHPSVEDADEKIFDEFFDAILAIGHMEPSWRGFVSYANAVRRGEIERPARQIIDDAPQVEPPELDAASAHIAAEPKRRGRRLKADVIVVDGETGDAVRPEIAADIDPETRKISSAEVVIPDADDATAVPVGEGAPAEPAFAAVKAAATRLFDEVLQQLLVNVEQTAREATARMLREVADEMEHAA